MPEKLTKEQQHERIWCGFTHIRVAWIFVAFCGLQVFMSWKDLDKPISRPDTIELAFYVLFVVVYVPLFWMILRCLTERFVIGIAAVDMAITVFSRFAPSLFVASLFNSVTVLVHRTFFALWIVAFLLSLNMPVQSMQHQYVNLKNLETRAENRGLLILGGVIATALRVGALLYFVPWR
jgi:hypothetical protein